MILISLWFAILCQAVLSETFERWTIIKKQKSGWDISFSSKALLKMLSRWCISSPAAADGLGSIAIDTTQLNMSVTDPTAWATAMNNLGMVPVGLAGQQLVTGKIFFSIKEVCCTNPWTPCLLLKNLELFLRLYLFFIFWKQYLWLILHTV